MLTLKLSAFVTDPDQYTVCKGLWPLITTRANTGARLRMPRARTRTYMLFFSQLKPYFNVCALTFSKFLHVKKQANQIDMQKNYGIDIFDYEGHNL